jgi:Flp pilus assembly protein TadD
LDHARSLYLRSAEADPTNAQTHNNLGIIAAIRGELPLAIGHFEDALKIDPDYEEARTNLARAQSST